MYDEDEFDEDYLYQDFGEGFEDEFDAVSEKTYEDSFKKEEEKKSEEEVVADEETTQLLENEEIDESEYEFDSVVGGRDKKPIMSALNKGKLSSYEMDDLLNQL